MYRFSERPRIWDIKLGGVIWCTKIQKKSLGAMTNGKCAIFI